MKSFVTGRRRHRARLWGSELVFLYNGSCWSYLFYVSRGLLKVHPAPSGSSEIGCAGLTQKNTEDTGFWFSHTKAPYQTHAHTHTHTHTLAHADTQHPVALSNHTARTYFCVVVSKESPCWAYSSPVNANPVCACVLIMIWSQRWVLSHRGKVSDQEGTGRVRWEVWL